MSFRPQEDAKVERQPILGELPTEFFEGEWHFPQAEGPEPWAVVMYAKDPSPETGHVGWCWWALGKIGEAPTYEAACRAAEAELQRRVEEVTSLVDSLHLGCEIAYRREPTQAEGDAHEYRQDQSMGASYGVGECYVPMGNHHGVKCKCGTWVWGGPTVCQRCVDREAVERAINLKMVADVQILAVRELLSKNGCDCDCEHHPEEHSDDCERCLPCRIEDVISKQSEKI